LLYKVLGNSGIRVSRLCLGTGAFGVAPLAPECTALVHRALDLGINVFDTANSYGNFERMDRPGAPAAAARESSETLLGTALKGRRDQAVVCTKVREAVGPGVNDYGLSRRHMMQQVERSLRALQTDYIDVYYAHGPDAETPLEETMRTLDDLVRQGKIRYFGLSNFAAWRMTHAIGLCDRLGLNRPIVHQIGYNLVLRGAEEEVIPACRHFGLVIAAFLPLNGGVLAGADVRSRPIIGVTRFVKDKSKPVPVPEEQLAAAKRLEELAEKWGRSPAHIALAWLFARPVVAAAIIGPESKRELESSVRAIEIQLDTEQLQMLDALCPPRQTWEALYASAQPAPLGPPAG
jgi:aryl-alcohol dehydrogenase-like predicted oxidoreductase